MKALDGKSRLTSNGALVAYYLLTLITAYFIGTIVPLIFVLVAEAQAQKEQAPLVRAHTKWLSRTILFGWLWNGLLWIPLTVGIISVFVSASDSLDTMAAEEIGLLFLDWEILIPLLCMLAVAFWQFYRVIRGLVMCVKGTTPKPNMA